MKDDFEEAKLAASFLGINDFGPNNSYIINQDLDDPDKSITRRQATKFTTELSKRLLKEPHIIQFGIVFMAGHGMIKDGR